MLKKYEKTISDLAARFGTPLYVYLEETILQRASELRSAFKGEKVDLCYAVKANSNISILKLFNQQGFGFDIVSEGELRRVIAAAGDPKKVVYSGVGKSAEEVRFALGKKIKLINVESPAEIDLLESISRELGQVSDISLRINPNIDSKNHPYIATGLHGNKFGMTLSDALQLRERLKGSKTLKLCGLDCHIGSQVGSLGAWEEAHLEMLKAVQHFKQSGFELQYLDLGGGFPIVYDAHDQALDFSRFAESFHRNRDPSLHYIFEPGRFLVGEAGLLISTVLLTKTSGTKKFLVIDAGMNDLIRPSLYEAYHEIAPLHEVSKEAELSQYDVVGPVCETGCFLGLDRTLPELPAGELLVIRNAGAYGFSMASNYNSRRLPAEVLLKADGSSKLIRRRQEYDQIYANEIF